MNKSEYKEALNKIVVSDELKTKIMRKCSSESQPQIHVNIYKKIYRAAGLAACLAVCLVSYFAFRNEGPFPGYVTSNTTPAPSLTQGPAASPHTDAATAAPQKSEVPSENRHDIAAPPEEQIYNSGHNSDATSSSFEVNNPPTVENPPDSNAKDHAENIDKMPTETIPGQAALPSSVPSNGDADVNQAGNRPMTAASPSEKTDLPGQGLVLNADAYYEENELSVKSLEQKLGYSIQMPHYIPVGYQVESVSLLFDKTAEIRYTDGMNTIYFRTAKSSEDISGDYTVYNDTVKAVIGDVTVTVNGNDALYYNASWFAADEAFSIYSRVGLEKITLLDIVGSVY